MTAVLEVWSIQLNCWLRWEEEMGKPVTWLFEIPGPPLSTPPSWTEDPKKQKQKRTGKGRVAQLLQGRAGVHEDRAQLDQLVGPVSNDVDPHDHMPGGGLGARDDLEKAVQITRETSTRQILEVTICVVWSDLGVGGY